MGHSLIKQTFANISHVDGTFYSSHNGGRLIDCYQFCTTSGSSGTKNFSPIFLDLDLIEIKNQTEEKKYIFLFYVKFLKFKLRNSKGEIYGITLYELSNFYLRTSETVCLWIQL